MFYILSWPSLISINVITDYFYCGLGMLFSVSCVFFRQINGN